MSKPADKIDSKAKKKATPAKGGAWEWIKSGLIGFAVFIVLRTFLIQTFTIISGSMEGTLLVGDFLFLNKAAYGATIPGTQSRLPGYTEPARGDIIVFIGYHEPKPLALVKRLIGMPGDTLAMTNGQLIRNGVPQDEPYVQHTDPAGDGTASSMDWQRSYLTDSAAALPYHPSRDNWGPIVVPDGKYFVMGDNRDQSLDSRFWGFIEPWQVRGRAVALYFSYDSQPEEGPPVLRHVRWNRIGDVLR
jgi:signal peptidase I